MNNAVPTAAFTGPLVDAEHPWLGLHPFTEENQHYFFGRTVEIRDIFLRVREQPLTVLYGQSGLGKTSLLRAGLIPKLRVQRFRPVRILLDFDAAAPPLIAQARSALASACADEKADAAALLARWQPLGSLWEIFAHESLRPADQAEHPPVLIFDQFEEVFTLGEEGGIAHAAGDGRRAEIADLIGQLADVIEGRAPAALAPLFDREPQRALAYDFGPTAARIVISLREDYLAQLEQWKSVLPSLMRNRMALRLLSGPQALEAVVRPGSMGAHPLVSEEVGAYIVRFVAQRDEATPLDEIEAVPPFLSLLCERLNDARLAAKPPVPEITHALVEAQGADILQRFYDESFAAFPATEREVVREYVEDRMVTIGGHRNPVAREDACAELAAAGVADPDAALDALVARRLLTAEQRGGIQRLEITHDVLAPLVVRARKHRQERRAAAIADRQRRELRRVRRIAAGFAVLGLLALGALVFAIFSLKQAQKHRARAEEALARAQASEQAAQSAKERAIAAKKSAEALISYMQYDLRDTLSKLGQLKMMEDINKQIREYYEQHPVEEGDNAALRERGSSLNDQGSLFLAQGKLAEALKAYRGALEIYQRLVKQDPNNTDWQRNLSLGLTNLGAVLNAQGKLGEALATYRESLAITERLVKRDPNNALWQTDLSACYNNIGAVLSDHGQLADALKAYLDSLAIRKRLAKKDPGNADWQTNLSESFNLIGDVLDAQGKPAEALKAYRDAFEITERLAKQEPANALWQRNLAAGFDRVGHGLSAQGKPAEALKAFHDSLTIRERLAKQDPNNADWQRDLHACFTHIGLVLGAQGQWAEALKAYRDSLVIGERLVKQDPNNAGWQRILSVSFNNIGDTLSAQGQPAEALQAYRGALAIVERLTEQDPENADWQRGLFFSLHGVAQVLEKQNTLVEALPFFERATEIAERLAKLDPTNATWQIDAKNSRADIERVRAALTKK
jgi:tetratricopeptide (TPR) repeat protein